MTTALAAALMLGGAVRGQAAKKEGRRGWVVWAAAAAAATVADVGLSQRCVHAYAVCREANPFLRGSRAQVWGLEASVTGGGSLLSLELRHGHRKWWKLPLEALTGSHAVGAVTAAILLKRLGRYGKE